ncbi:GldK: gliding motility-associated lipoprotein GldK [Cardinium endosymbiont of Sogatella furcifera]|uniref:formylglycine-generating enzyme family protein n=1 Tax=Cardinium endosymbiont of Sogatella furcifera TaxID=650378 RepID=UPI000E0DAA9C|nr:SUMF1/EgtB/PvdO family nonheme iron enzyme [Cardinium endosymbiont of Sogatella furcifera]AXI24095.1 GldK: gliding motility-associated lipoprotein GldK [Cardinium endosymbiont of Sogatella furcifera]
MFMLLVSYNRFLPKHFRHNLARLLWLAYITISSCSALLDDEGEIIGDNNKSTSSNKPPIGMVLIRAGSCVMGSGVNQSVVAKTNITQMVTVGPFYMDEAPVTNAQYRKFIAIVQADPAAYGLDEAYINEKLMPDPTVWKRDFGFMFMDDSFGKSHWEDPRFDAHPVVGITWEAAQQYARIRTIRRNKHLEAKGRPPGPSFRLPTEAEWERAAKGGKESGQYPFGGPSVRDKKGNLLANFQVTKGNYAASGYAYTSPVKAFPPNAYGLYDMAGNVYDWCANVPSTLLIHKNETISPFYKDEDGVFRVIKGGSWKDYSYALQTGVSDYEHKDMARAYIGFRCVMSAI